MKDIWKEGKYFDLWSINHLLSGGILAGFFILIGIKFWKGFLISFLIMVSWELYEIFKRSKERKGNQIIDIALGIFGFLIAYFLIIDLSLSLKIIVFTTLTILFLFLEVLGFLAYRKRKKLNKN